MMKAKSKSVVVIGAGIGGLSCAARLAAAGLQVTVLEKNDHVGGKLGLLQQDRFTWDSGPSLFTQPYLLQDLFEACGFRLEDFFSYRSPDEGTQYFWDNGETFHAAPGKSALMANAAKAFSEDATNRLSAYLEDATRLYHSIGSIFLDEPVHRLRTWQPRRILPALAALKPAYLLSSLHRYNMTRLRHPKLVQVLDRMATYNGSDPYQCPAMLSTIAHLEFCEGTWYPDGGMASIPAALRALCGQLGVAFCTGTEAERIVQQQSGIIGVDARARRFPADAVVSNADVFYTYRDLLHDASMANKTARQERSSSGLVFYWGMAKIFEGLRLHNIFFSEDYRAEFRAIFGEKTLPQDPTIYVNITSKMEAEHAPDGGENWFVLINAPSGKEAMSKEKIAALRGAVLRKISRILGEDISLYIATESVLTPDGIARNTGAYMGALYGTSSNSAMAAFNRHPNFSRRYPGLFFAGGTVHPGGGIPLCLRSGKLAAGEVLRYLGVNREA